MCTSMSDIGVMHLSGQPSSRTLSVPGIVDLLHITWCKFYLLQGEGMMSALLTETQIQLLQLIPAAPYSRKQAATAAFRICICRVLTLLHRLLLQAVEKSCDRHNSQTLCDSLHRE